MKMEYPIIYTTVMNKKSMKLGNPEWNWENLERPWDLKWGYWENPKWPWGSHWGNPEVCNEGTEKTRVALRVLMKLWGRHWRYWGKPEWPWIFTFLRKILNCFKNLMIGVIVIKHKHECHNLIWVLH